MSIKGQVTGTQRIQRGGVEYTAAILEILDPNKV